MKPRFVIIMLITMLVCTHSQAQQVVIDPSQIAASAVNAADQMDYMLDVELRLYRRSIDKSVAEGRYLKLAHMH